MSDIIIEGDEAWLREDWEKRERRRKYERDLKRNKYASDPEYRERIKAYMRQWRALNHERVKAYSREWMRRKRGPRTPRPPPVEVLYNVGSLHDGACTGPTTRTGCKCHKIRVVALAPVQAESAA